MIRPSSQRSNDAALRLEYPLAGETLAAGTTRGVSNVFTETEARVVVESGVLVAVRPDGAAA